MSRLPLPPRVNKRQLQQRCWPALLEHLSLSTAAAAAMEDSKDEDKKDDDPVVREIDVVLADWGDPTDDAGRPGLALLQYPVRARARGPEPFDVARIKPRNELLEVEVPATTSGPHFDDRAPERVKFDRRTLSATTVAPETNYAVGALRGGVLRVAPIAATYQMRPSFAYVDAADEADAPAPAPASARDAPKLQAASVKRVPTTRDQSHARGSYAQRRQAQEAEPWLELVVHQKDGAASKAKRARLNPTGS